MNELQIRLTADIKDLQSALNKAKASLKSFESETAADSEKSNVGFRRKIGLIEQLTAKAKALKVSLSQATNEQQIAKFNAELEQTNIELSRLNSLGKSFADTSVQSFNKFRVSAGAANGSAIAFNRIIQDAPFGIIGVGNNIQQFAEQLSALRVTTGSTSSALSTFFGSLLTKSNLIVLGISAVTAAFTAYQLGVFDTKKEVDELTKAQEDFNESLKDTNGLLAQGLLNKLLKEVGLLKTENLGGRLVDVPAFKTAGQVVDALSGKINKLRKGELELLEGFLTEQISTATRAFANSNIELEKSLATEEIGLYKGILEQVNDQLSFYNQSTKTVIQDNKELKRSFEELSSLPSIGLPRSGDVEALLKQRQRLLEGGKVGTTGQEFINAELNKVKEQGIITERPLGDLTQKLEEETPIIQDQIGVIVDAFSSLGAGIAGSLNIGDRALRGFVTTLLSATPKIIGAILQKAATTKAAQEAENASNLKLATGNVIVSSTEAAKGLGPVGLALLPVFIAGAVALVSSAFGRASSGGGSPSAGSGSTYTNRREFGGPVSKGRAYIVGEKRPELFVPNTNGVIVPQVPSMDYSGASVNSGMYGVEVMLKGPDDLLFFVEQAQIRRNIR
jgi:hypothetical protein